MSRKQMRYIDGKKIEESMVETGISKRFVSRRLGHRDDYIQRAIRDGRLPDTELKMFADLVEKDPSYFTFQDEVWPTIFDYSKEKESEDLIRLCGEIIDAATRLRDSLTGGNEDVNAL